MLLDDVIRGHVPEVRCVGTKIWGEVHKKAQEELVMNEPDLQRTLVLSMERN